MDKRQVGQAIRKRRLQLGLTQRELAEAIQVEPSYIARIENGNANFTIHKLLGLAKFLKTPVYSFFHARPLTPYKDRDPRLVFGSPEADYAAIKLFADPSLLAPGHDLSEMIPLDYAPILKDSLPEGALAEKDRIVALVAQDGSMAPTIHKGAVVWIDRKDVEPRARDVFAFWLREPHSAVTIKRLVHIDHHFLIIDGDARSEKERSTPDLKDYPRALNIKEYESRGFSPLRGKVIWVLNKMSGPP